MTLKFLGTVTFADVDAAARTVVVTAKGADQLGRGNAGAVTRMQVVPEDGGSTVLLDTVRQAWSRRCQTRSRRNSQMRCASS